MPDPISACNFPISYYEEAPEQSPAPPKTPRQAACEAAYAECEQAAAYEAAGFSMFCGGSGLITATATGPFAPIVAVGAFIACEAKTLLDFEADEAMCRSNYYRCDNGSP